MDKISKSVQDEATNGLYPKVPDTDIVPEIIHVSNKIFLAFSFILQLTDMIHITGSRMYSIRQPL